MNASETKLRGRAPELHFEMMPLSRFDGTEAVEADAALLQSVEKQGVWVPIICGMVDGRFVVEDGLRRLSAAREVGLEAIPVLWHEGLMPEVLLTVNTCRAHNWRAEFRVYLELTRSGQSATRVGRALGLDKKRLRQHAKLVRRLCEDAKTLFMDGKLSFSSAKRLSKQPKGMQVEILRDVRHGDMSDAAINEAIRKFKSSASAARGKEPSRVAMGSRRKKPVIVTYVRARDEAAPAEPDAGAEERERGIFAGIARLFRR